VEVRGAEVSKLNAALAAPGRLEAERGQNGYSTTAASQGISRAQG
jgi:hypothetical protein